MADATIAELADRLRQVEDELAIIRLLASYGPAVDSGESQVAARMWTADGVYDVGGVACPAGHDQLAAMYDGEQHQSIIAGGAAHLTSTPIVHVHGDRATAIAHSFVFRREAEGYGVWRASANRWTLIRTRDGWRIQERLNRVLDGSPAARDVLRGGGGR